MNNLEELDEMNWSARGNVLNQYLSNTSIGTTVKPRACSTSGFGPDKTRPVSLLNGFKHDYKFDRYTALLVMRTQLQ